MFHIHSRETRNTFIATLDSSWNFSSTENLESLNLQDEPQSGIIFLRVTRSIALVCESPFSATTHRIFLSFKLRLRGKPKLKILEMKTTSNGRWPQNIKSRIPRQPFIRSCSKFKLKLTIFYKSPNPSHRISLWEPFLSNHSSDLPQILNLGWGDQTKIEDSWNEDDLQWKTTSKYKK